MHPTTVTYNITLYAGLVPFLYFYGCWILYLAVMNLKRARDAGTLTTAAKIFGWPVVYVGLALDFIGNLLLSVLVLDMPRELTMTAHLNKLLAGGNSYQKAVANWVCNQLLDVFDPSGHHCNCGAKK